VEGGEAVAWWKLKEDGDEGNQIFVDSRRGQQLRWTQQVREALKKPLEPLEVPPNYELGECDASPEDGARSGGSVMGPTS
jgi:hypothetical protein